MFLVRGTDPTKEASQSNFGSIIIMLMIRSIESVQRTKNFLIIMHNQDDQKGCSIKWHAHFASMHIII